jgi:single-strand DNA-binding protein|uniref:Single-stranded DNA-binding protein n=1 Tax=Siphoviridae sp. ctKvA22 TaxID=2826246 RepID=A0A8S5MAA2_9CAUD|nr:MAG TPA: Single strand binding protein [Siphoviridae sp. ctKvA22]
MNKVILMGRLTSDPKMDWTRSEDSKQYATYTLAVNRRFKRNGEQEADFINCVAWGAMAEFAEKYMKKGVMFAVEGRLNVRSWDDAEGKKHWTTTVVVENSYFTGSKKDTESKPAAEQSQPAAAQEKPAKQMGLADSPGFYPIDETIEDDDLPF